jgi:3-oxoacyl-[acyl-carrier-protein] synthase-3
MSSIGILGLGTYLPPTVRTNDWWPKAVVDDWRSRQARRFTNLSDMTDLGPGAKLVLEHTARVADDPFEGARERRVIDDQMTGTDMGIAAAKDAFARAGIGPADVDFLLVQSMVPDYHNTPDGCRIHRELGIKPSCFTATIDASCSGFLTQLTVAQGLITAGIGRVGLLVQCAPMSRILRASDPWSAAFGDAATAVVVGPVTEGRGILAQAHGTDGRFHGGLVTGVPGARWHDEGAAYMYVEDNDRARGMVMSIPDAVKTMIESSLKSAGIAKEDVNFLAAHQATIWFGELVQAHVGLPNAKRVNTFPWTTSLSGCNLPFVMAIAEREGLLNEGDAVVMFSGATGMTAGALVCRWGR